MHTVNSDSAPELVIVNWPNGLTKFQNMFLLKNCSHQNVAILLNSIQNKTLCTVLVPHNLFSNIVGAEQLANNIVAFVFFVGGL